MLPPIKVQQEVLLMLMMLLLLLLLCQEPGSSSAALAMSCTSAPCPAGNHLDGEKAGPPPIRFFLVSGQRHFIWTNVELFSFWGGHPLDQSASLDLVHRELPVHGFELHSPIAARERRSIPPSLECSLIILSRGTVQERKLS